MDAGDDGPIPYNFEPVVNRERQDDAQLEPEVEEQPEPEGPPQRDENRLQNIDWCSCGLCVFMPTAKECTCCREITNCLGQAEGHNCVTESPDFHSVCLNKAVLKTAIVMLRYARGLTKPNDEYDNKTYRYTAYRSFTAWIHGALGKRQRKVIPACAVSSIRSAYPADDGIYKGFLEAQGEVEDALLL